MIFLNASFFGCWPGLLFGLILLALGPGSVPFAQAEPAVTPSFTISKLADATNLDSEPFGITVEAIRQVTPDAQYFFFISQGLNALKNLGVKALLYTVDRNNWRALYDDMNGSPQVGLAAITPTEIVSIADAIGAELVPILNVTVQCKHIDGTAYTSQNMTCKNAKVKDSVDLVKFFKQEAAHKGVEFKRVVLKHCTFEDCSFDGTRFEGRSTERGAGPPLLLIGDRIWFPSISLTPFSFATVSFQTIRTGSANLSRVIRSET
jgi:hypothetical protein